MIGLICIKRAASRWRTAYKNRGITGLEDSRKHRSGRSFERELNLEEKYARLEARMRLLEAENEMLKKLDLLEMKEKSRASTDQMFLGNKLV